MLTAASARTSDSPNAPRTEFASTNGTKGKKAVQAPAGQYFIEFRSRYALSYGHTFAMFGRLDRRGQITDREVAGLHPAGDSPVPWMIGHVVPVPSETGPSDGDLEEKYVSARYRVVLSAADYERVTAFIRKLQANSPLWSATVYNCNAFVADIARYMGLKTPSSTLLYPADFINQMRNLNGDRNAS
ncbi:hypothetical protein [Microvirga sp. M2]|uniref:hypothetical protein n=1 Tax=Microvirga sp. M2 TaxID=3073270 RepID=UPI0039C37063